MTLGQFNHPVDPEDILLPVCDVLVLEALRTVGRFIVRYDRPRPKLWRGRPLWEAHTNPAWPVDDAVVTRALRNAWDIIPVMLGRWEDLACLDDEELLNTLDGYVRDLVVTHEPHSIELLRQRIDSVFPPL